MRSRRRKRRIMAPVLIGIVLFGLIGFFVLPPIVKAQVEKQMTAQLGRTVTVGKVRLNPFALSVTLEDLDVREKDGSASFFGWRRLYVRFDALLSLAGEWVLGDIELDGFHAGVTVNHDGSFSFSDLLAKFAPPSSAPAKPGRPIRISRLSVSDAQVHFIDLTPKHPFETIVGPLTFSLTGFRTAGSSGAPYHFEATTEAGESLDWSGTLVADPFSSSGDFKLGGIVLKKYAPYLEGLSRGDVTDGKLGLQGSYAVNLDPKVRTLQVNGADLSLRGLRIVERSGARPAVELGAVDVGGISIDAVAMKASVAKATLSGGHASVRRNADGSVNLLGLLNPEAPASPAAPGPKPPEPSVSIGEVALSDFKVDIEDDTLAHPAHLGITGLQASVRNVTLAKGAVMPVHVAFGWEPKGTVLVDGTLSLSPDIQADVKASVSRFEVLPFSPYVEQFVNARITQGSVSTISAVHVSLAGGRPSLTVSGDLSVDKFGLVDGIKDKELAGFSWLAIAGMDIATSPVLSVSVKQVDIDGPYARVRVDADKSLNLLSLVRPQPAAKSPAPAGPAPKVEVGKVVIDGGEFSFHDLSIDPAVRVSIVGFGGTISGLSSQNIAKADVDLKGLVGGAAPVEISGKLDPLGAQKYVGLKIDVRNVDLLPLSPYSGRYAGFDLARGQLVVDSNILVDGDKVDATNVVTLNQFTFGAATSSPDATGLPVRLGVALLKDTDGRIVIDLPVQGTLGDPNFRVGKVVLRVIVNLLTKAAVSPFALVGSMFGGGGQELAYQEFAPGSSTLEPTQTPKLDTLVKALANRPALSLGLEGGFDAAADAYALKRTKLADLVRRRVWEEKHALNPNIEAPDRLQVSAEDYAAMVKKLFDAKFPPGTQFGTPLPAPPAVSAPPPAPPASFITRVVDFITFKAQRDEKAARDAAQKRDLEHEAEVQKAVAAGLPQDEMAGRLAEALTITDNDLLGLAAARAQSVRNYLATTGHIALERLFLSKPAGPSAPSKGPRVLLTLE